MTSVAENRISLPTEYSFVTLSLDPEATVSNLKNEELSAACRRLQRKTFVAFTGERRQFFMPWEPYHSWQFYLVFQGLREENVGQGIEPQMSVPILPNTTHPLCREPLDPGYALPWNDCYISEFIQFDARVATRVTEEEPVCCTTSEEATRIRAYFDEDIQRRRELEPQIVAVRAITGSDGIDCSDTDSEAPWSSSFVDEYGSMEEAQYEDRESTPLRKGGESGARIMLDEMTSRPHSNLFVVEVSFDLSSTDQIHNPDNFFEEVAFLKKLTIELENARKQREIENAQRIDEEHFAAVQAARNKPPQAYYARRWHRRITTWMKMKNSFSD
ncbi:hypothetical protein GGU10DRAFT_161026 [Lentinula aff. detonsa]|uniref:Uncharacterized protein n=1 Tax=Lentinula aff. detonsa TaxID=2804958 RepID=A0AA38KQT5_9AGAR|nr:hypothetical protein GGU10DRAFT_161026 [Lentinula aff. detonsa]